MKKTKVAEMRAEYGREDLGEGIRGKFLKSYREGTNLVLLSPDVAEAFPTEEAVNDALRSLIKIARHAGLSSRSRRREKASHD
jgi:hypothetical protein